MAEFVPGVPRELQSFFGTRRWRALLFKDGVAAAPSGQGDEGDMNAHFKDEVN